MFPAPREQHSSSRAFTLIELLVVILIVVVLATVLIGAGRSTTTTAQVAQAKAEMAGLAAGLESYRRTYGDFPQTSDAATFLQCLVGRRGPTGAFMEGGGAMLELSRFSILHGLDPLVRVDAVLSDPWGQPYCYAYQPAESARQSTYLLYSPGPDGSSTQLVNGSYSDGARSEDLDNVYAHR